jgi:hypothetical protein
MLDHMKKPHTKVTLLFEGPSDRHGEAIAALKSLGFNIAGEDRERIPWREAFKEFEGNEAGHNLAGGRHKEALTHVQLSKITGCFFDTVINGGKADVTGDKRHYPDLAGY